MPVQESVPVRPAPQPPPAQARRRTGLVGALAYLAVALFTQVRALGDPCGRTQPDGDVPQTDWFLAWTPHALGSGKNPVFSDALNVPDGVNLMWNTTMPLLGLLAAPVTAACGPAASHTLLLVLAFLGSMLAMRWCASAFTRRPAVAWLAGLAYGCSPYMSAQAIGHLNLTWAVTPPLIARVLYELYTGRRPWRQSGLLLAGLATAQFLITEEVLVSAAVAAAAGTAVVALRHRRDLDRARVATVAKGLALGAGVPLVLLSPLVAFQLAGPQALAGPATEPVSYAADVLGAVLPSRAQLLSVEASAGFAGNASENGSFLGVALIGLLLWACWRRPGVHRDWALVALSSWVLSLGGFVRFGGEPTPVKLPFLAVWKVPLLGSLIPARFSLYCFLAVVLALVAASEAWSLPRSLPGRLGAGVLALAVAVPLLPSWPYAYVDLTVPEYFTGSGVRALPEGTLLQTYPVARHHNGSPGTSSPMHWQAYADFRYRTTAGYVITPDAAGEGTFDNGGSAFETASTAAAQGRPVTEAGLEQVRADWAARGVDAVVVDPTATGAARVAALLTSLTGRGPDQEGQGVQVWTLS